MIREASETNFLGDIAEGTVLVMVSTPYCGPCINMKQNVLPSIEDIDIVVVDASTQMMPVGIVQSSAGPINSVPILILYKDGKFVKRQDGGMSLEEIQSFIEE